MKEKVVVQFGEAANSTLIHFWNHLKELGDAGGDGFGGYSIDRSMIYSQRRPFRGIVGEATLSTTNVTTSASASTSAQALQAEKTGHWTDYNYYYDYPASQYRESPLFDSLSAPLSSIHFDAERMGAVEEVIEEDFRVIAEGCDELREFTLLAPEGSVFGAVALQTLTFLNDEYGKKRKLLFSLERDLLVDHTLSTWSPPALPIEEALAFALQAQTIRDQTCTIIPLRCTNLPRINNFDFSTPASYTPAMASVLFDALCSAPNEIPTTGTFASLLLHTPLRSLDLTSLSIFGPLELPHWRPSASGSLITQALFDPKPFAFRAQKSITLLSDRRSLDRVGGVDLGESLIERLHELKDAWELETELY